MVPGEPAEGIPVRRREWMAAPVAVVARVGHARDAGERLVVEAAVDDPRDRRAGALREGVGLQAFAEEGREEGEIGALAEIFLGDLQLEHLRRARHGAEERVHGLAGLEVDRAVLDLHQHIRPELAVQRLELVVGLLRPVVRDVLVVDERAPHHDAAVRRERVGQHVGAVGMGAAIILRAGLAFRVGLHQEPAEVGDQTVDLVRLVFPPPDHGGIERIGGFQAADFDRRAEPRREVDADAIRTEDVSQGRDLAQPRGGQHEGGRRSRW